MKSNSEALEGVPKALQAAKAKAEDRDEIARQMAYTLALAYAFIEREHNEGRIFDAEIVLPAIEDVLTLWRPYHKQMAGPAPKRRVSSPVPSPDLARRADDQSTGER